MASFGRETVEAALRRLKKLLSVRTDNELAECLDMTSSGLSAWKRRGSIDIALILEKLPNTSIDWLLAGVGEPYTYNDSLDIMEPIKLVREKNTEYIRKSLMPPTIGKVSRKANIKSSDLANELKESPTIPIFYGVSAGNPTVTFNELKGYYKYDYLVNERTIGIDMNTDEYSGYGLQKGDIIIIDTAREPQNGNLVLVKIEGTFDILYYYDNNGSIYYEKVVEGTKNKKYNVDNLIDVSGVAIAKIRKL